MNEAVKRLLQEQEELTMDELRKALEDQFQAEVKSLEEPQEDDKNLTIKDKDDKKQI